MPADLNEDCGRARPPYGFANHQRAPQQLGVRSASTTKLHSPEYASVTPPVAPSSDRHPLYIHSATDRNDDDAGSREAIDKITEKYDSLGKLKSSLQKLDLLNDDDDDDVIRPTVTELSDGGEDERRFHQQMARDDDEEDSEAEGKPDSTSGRFSPAHYRLHHELSEREILQVEAFFRGHKTVVTVCPTIANLYVSTAQSSSSQQSPPRADPRAIEAPSSGDWRLMYTGIPLLLLDGGDTRSRTKRRIQIVLAERGTGFLLWKDTIDNLTNYRATDAHFHTMFLSSDHRRTVGLSFRHAVAARELYDRIELLTADPANISLSGPGCKDRKRKEKKSKRKVEKIRLPKKTDISSPCCFQHLTSVDMEDRMHFVTLATLTGKRPPPPLAPGNGASGGSDSGSERLTKFKSEPALGGSDF